MTPFTKDLIFPDKNSVSHILLSPSRSDLLRNITVFSFKKNKTAYMSHFFELDPQQNGRGAGRA